METPVYHIPALLTETLNSLNIRKGGCYVDVTFGGGGHSGAIYDRLVEQGGGKLFSLDQDIEAIRRAAIRENHTLIHGNFRFLRNFARFYDFYGKTDGILADLGVSFHHFDDPGRGFSFRFDGPLDMRMNQKARKTAAMLLNEASAERIEEIFRLYGEFKNSRKLAAAIVRERAKKEFVTTEQLLEVIEPMLDPRRKKQEMAQIFQALRIEVNDEIGALKSLLTQSLEVLAPGGRLAIITYHSLEDRLVKNFMKTGNLEGKVMQDFFGRNLSPFRLLTSRPIVPSEEEIENNPRSRSAKLRVAEKTIPE